MHLYVAVRGVMEVLDRWEKDLSSIFLPIEFKDSKGNSRIDEMRLQVRPIRLYEIVFPEPYKDEVLATIWPENWRKRDNKFLWFLRKIFNCDEKIKLPDKPNNKLVRNFVEVAGIGIKKDKYDENGVEII